MTGRRRRAKASSGSLGDLIVRRREKPGSAPGLLVVDKLAAAPVLEVLAFDAGGVEEASDVPPAEIEGWLQRRGVVWINFVGLGDAAVLDAVGRIIGIHPLALEDVINVYQRPKVDDYDEQLFLVARMPRRDESFETEQVSLFVKDRLVVSFQEDPGDCFDAVRGRLRRGSGRARHRGADYLAYALLDAITDAYFPLLEKLGDELEELEDETLSSPGPGTVAKLHEVKRELLHIRRAVWPLREVFNAMQRDSLPVISEETRIYLRDCYDHVVQLMDIIENYREIVAGLLDVYLSSVSNRMNEVMKVLTIVATIFIPLTFITGLYGMNFDNARSPWNMPELEWYFGYPLVLLIMILTSIGMLLYFRKLGWLGGSRKAP